MKYKGRITAVVLVLIANCVYITYYFLRDGYIGIFELIGLPIMLFIAWWSGKQYGTLKLLKEKDELTSKELLEGKTEHYTLEKRYFRKDGQLVWGEVTSALFQGLNDESYYAIGMVNDITKRKIAEQQLKEAY